MPACSCGHIRVLQGDCLELMQDIPDKSIDAIVCDLPYGTTACKWDSIIPFDSLWLQYKRIIRDNGAIVLFGGQPFTSALIMSNIRGFCYIWEWNKRFGANFVQAKRQPIKIHEDIIIFSKHGKMPVYNPQKTNRTIPIKKGGNKQSPAIPIAITANSQEFGESDKTYFDKFPISILEFNTREGRGLHPTQKPVTLLEYLIKTYTNEGDLILDNCAGSGTTGIACLNTNRRCILIEKEPQYIEIIKERLASAYPLFA